jgi:hypothetical protein
LKLPPADAHVITPLALLAWARANGCPDPILLLEVHAPF